MHINPEEHYRWEKIKIVSVIIPEGVEYIIPYYKENP